MTNNTETRAYFSHNACDHGNSPADRRRCRKARNASVSLNVYPTALERLIDEIAATKANVSDKQRLAAVERLEAQAKDYTEAQIEAVVDATRRQKASIAKLSDKAIAKILAA